MRCLAAAPHAKVVPGLSCAAARPSGRSASHRNDGSGEWHVISGKAVALPAYRVAILARAGVPPGPPDQLTRLERYRQEHPDVDIQPPGAQSAVWRAFRDGELIAYGFTLMVFMERLEALPEPLSVVQDFDLQHLARRPPAASPVKMQPVHLLDRRHPNGQAGPGGECASAGW